MNSVSEDHPQAVATTVPDAPEALRDRRPRTERRCPVGQL